MNGPHPLRLRHNLVLIGEHVEQRLLGDDAGVAAGVDLDV